MKITIEQDGKITEYKDVKEVFIAGLSASPELFVSTGKSFTEFSFWDGSYSYLIGKLSYYLHRLKQEEINANTRAV